MAAIDTAVASQRLGTVLAAPAAYTVVHCCGQPTPFPEIKAADASAVSFDLGFLRPGTPTRLPSSPRAGVGLFAGALPAASAQRLVSGPPLAPRQTAEQIVTLWRRTGLAPDLLTEQVVITPGLRTAGRLAGRGAGGAPALP